MTLAMKMNFRDENDKIIIITIITRKKIKIYLNIKM